MIKTPPTTRTADHRLLDSYAIERMAFARKLVSTTDRVFSFVTAEGAIADLLRTRVAPLLLPKMAALERAREWLFRTVSQITLNYRAMPLSAGHAGTVFGGDRLPWVQDAERDNFSSLALPAWQVQVFAYTPDHAKAGLACNGFYLLRPDSYVALADPGADPKVIERYFHAHGIKPFMS